MLSIFDFAMNSNPFRSFHFFYILLVFGLAAFTGCDKKKGIGPLVYEGPVREAENVVLLYSEDQIIKVRLEASRVYEYANGDREFPEEGDRSEAAAQD